jgi:hypothetical protein
MLNGPVSFHTPQDLRATERALTRDDDPGVQIDSTLLSTDRAGDSTIVTGPWFGEFGVLLARWVPYVRWIRRSFPQAWLIAGGYADEICLYRDIADEFWAIDPALRQAFRDAETANNYGTLPSLRDDYGVHAHTQRKGFPDTRGVHDSVARAWLTRLRHARHCPVTIACTLHDGRAHQRLDVEHATEVRRTVDLREGVDSQARPLVMLLPRQRRHQGLARSWPLDVYAAAVEALVEGLDVTVVLLGSALHEPDPLGIRLPCRTIDLSHDGLHAQLAYWQIAATATGALSGGLVPTYFTDTKPVFWHKGATLPTAPDGAPWPDTAEPAYAVMGVTADWVRVDTRDDLPALVAAVGRTL